MQCSTFIIGNAEVGKGKCQVTARSFKALRRIEATFSHASARAEAQPAFGCAISRSQRKVDHSKSLKKTIIFLFQGCQRKLLLHPLDS